MDAYDNIDDILDIRNNLEYYGLDPNSHHIHENDKLVSHNLIMNFSVLHELFNKNIVLKGSSGTLTVQILDESIIDNYVEKHKKKFKYLVF